MVTVVDALMITAGLDASGFLKGQRDMATSLAKTKDQALKSTKEVEKSATGMADAFGKASTSVLELGAILMGGRGFKEMIENATKANTAMSLLSNSMALAPDFVGAWGIAAARMGGSAGSAEASIKSLSDQLVDFRTLGKDLPIQMHMLAGKSGVNIDFQHGVERYMITAAAAAKELAKTDPAAASRFLAAMGLDPATAALMIQRGKDLKTWIDQQKKYIPSDKDRAAARDMTDAQTKLSSAYDLVAAKLLTALSPALIWMANALEKVIMAIAKWIEDNPGWTKAIAAVVALLTGAGIVAAIASVTSLALALGGLAGISLGGILATLAALGVAGAAAAAAIYAAGGFDDDEAKTKDGGKPLGGNDALRRRGRSPDLALGKGGNLSANQKEAYAAARGEGLSEKAARALVANMSGEGLPRDAHRVHWDGSHFAHGIVQWDDERSARIKGHFGKMPEAMSVAEQTRAAIWEIRNNGRFASTRRALEGDNAGDMIDKLVRNYESPADKGGAIARRSQIYQGLGNLGKGSNTAAPSLWTGGVTFAPAGGAPHAAALNNISNSSTATTSTSSNTAHIGQITVNAPSTSDAHSVGRTIDKALSDSLFASHANFGPA